MAGYSGTPLVKKLGINPGARMALVNAPRGFAQELGKLPAGAKKASDGALDFVLVFAKDRAEMKKHLQALARHLEPAGMLWVAWPKKASGVATDLTENLVRDAALPMGLVDVKVCAVNEVWSGLKLVVRKENRETWPAGVKK
ncbi:MAG TPA: DUF3052 family protein [Terriglobales bacterium]|jgi:hypothetical protein|nr:DUF3052 family protein [Terriglobales bacterium]